MLYLVALYIRLWLQLYVKGGVEHTTFVFIYYQHPYGVCLSVFDFCLCISLLNVCVLATNYQIVSCFAVLVEGCHRVIDLKIIIAQAKGGAFAH